LTFVQGPCFLCITFKGGVWTGTFNPKSAHLSDSLLFTGTTKPEEV